jgi:hypothetical protein
MAVGVVGAGGAALLFQLLLRLEVSRAAAGWITIGVIGSAFGWIASTGSLWFYPEVLGIVLSLVALYWAIDGRSSLVAGLLIGLAAGSRLPTGLVLPLILWFYRDRRQALVWCLAGVAIIVVALLGGWLRERPRSPTIGPSLTRFDWSLPAGTGLDSAPVVSPDGRRIAFTAVRGGVTPRLFVRSLDSPVGPDDEVHIICAPSGG